MLRFNRSDLRGLAICAIAAALFLLPFVILALWPY